MKTHKKVSSIILFIIFALASFAACGSRSGDRLSPEQRRAEMEHLARSTSIRVFNAIEDGNRVLAMSYMTDSMQREFTHAQGFDAEVFMTDLFDTVGGLSSYIPGIGGIIAAGVGGLGDLLVDGGQALFQAGADLFNRVTGRPVEEAEMPRIFRNLSQIDVYLVGERFAIATGVVTTTGPEIDIVLQGFSNIIDNVNGYELEVWQYATAQLARRFNVSHEDLTIDSIRQALTTEAYEFRLENIEGTWYVYAMGRIEN